MKKHVVEKNQIVPKSIYTNTKIKKIKNLRVKRLLQVLSNLSRTFLGSLLGIILNYILVRYKASGVLTTYVYSISIINLLFVFANWGGKNYLTKIFAKEPWATKELTAKLLGSKILFFFLICPILIFLPINFWIKLFIAAYLLLKTVGQVFEALIVFRKKYHFSLLIESLLAVILIIVVYVDGNTDNPIQFLFELLIIELLRVIVYLYKFRTEAGITLKIDKIWNVIKSSSTFFYISLAGFLCSKADLYVTGFFHGKQSMSSYFIITNLVSLCLIAYASINSTFEAGIMRYSQKSFTKFVQFSSYTGFIYSLVSASVVYILSVYYFKITLSFWFYGIVVINVFGFTRVLMQMYEYTRSEKQGFVLQCLLISGFINIILSCLLTNFIGTTGAFAANTIAVYINLLLLKRIKFY
jgi:O-antigen/teichoic acid export membrane protein